MFLIFGAFLVLLALIGTFTGEVWAGHGSIVCRNEDSEQFWSVVIVYYVIGLGLIACYLYTGHGHSH